MDSIAGAVHYQFKDLLFGCAGRAVAEDRDVSVATDFGEGHYAGGIDRLLDVGRVVRLHFSEHSDGFELRVRAVAVVAKFDAWSSCFAGGSDAFDVELRIEADLDLERLEA